MTPIRSLVVATVLLSVAGAAGCLDAEDSRDPWVDPGSWPEQWTRDPCDPTDADISGNAPVLDSYRGEPVDVARRLAETLGKELPPPYDGPGKRWQNDSLRIEYRTDDDGKLKLLYYQTRDTWPGHDADEGKRRLRSALETFAGPDIGPIEISPPGRNGNVYTFWQTWQGDRLGIHGRVTVGGHFSTLLLPVTYDLSDARSTIPRQDVLQTATTYDRCVMDRRGRTADDGYRLDQTSLGRSTVHHGSLTAVARMTYSDPDPGHCGNLTNLVYVDAATGAVHGWRPPTCA